MKRLLKFLDNNLIKILLMGFIFLVPLWPKLPIKMINYTYIAVRLEDLYLVVMTLAFFIQLIRKKEKLNKTFLILFVLFWLALFISTAWGIFISKTIVYYHLGLLHSLRRVEYMIVFFIAASVIKKKKDFFHLMTGYFLAVFLIVLYGLGQRFLGFPAVQTMNPEYAKGYILYLTPETRISSTFAGHYDLASYIIFAIPLMFVFLFFAKKRSNLLFYILALLVLVYTSSRISFVAYVITAFLLLIIIRKYLFLFFAVVLTVGMFFSTGELANRFMKTVQIRRILVNEKTGSVYVSQNITTKELPAGTFYIKLNKKAPVPTPILDVNTFKTQIVEQQIHEATLSGKISSKKQIEELMKLLTTNIKPVNSIVSDISFSTRLQVEWPRAIDAFLKNPVLGTGPSSITEATDNDFLRWLGESGLLGTILFLIILFSITFRLLKLSKKTSQDDRQLSIGFIFSLIALLINATYIDVFEASKVAYTFWTVAGLFVGYYSLKTLNTKSQITNKL